MIPLKHSACYILRLIFSLKLAFLNMFIFLFCNGQMLADIVLTVDYKEWNAKLFPWSITDSARSRRIGLANWVRLSRFRTFWLCRAVVFPCTAAVPHATSNAAHCFVCGARYFCHPSTVPLERKHMEMSTARLCNAAVS